MKIFRSGIALIAGLAMTMAAPALAQIETIDPNAAYDQPATQQDTTTQPSGNVSEWSELPVSEAAPADSNPVQDPAASSAVPEDGAIKPDATTDAYQEDDLIGAAEGVFGKGAEGLAKMIEDLLKKQGKPNGYIVGREGGGAFVLGLRYGSGTLYHKVEGKRPVYWTGPSVGLDAGANAGNTFVLVYNLHDTEELFKRFGAAEGQAYLVGGFHASYLRKGDIVLIPIRMGVGLRLGLNAGYMKFSRKQNWLPF